MLDKKKKIDFKFNSKRELSFFIIISALCLLCASSLPILLSSNMLFSIKTTKDYVANELSDEDLISPLSFSFIDEDATEEKKDDEERKINPYFTYSYNASLLMKSRAQEAFDYLVNDKELKDEELISIERVLLELKGDSEKNYENAAILRETIDYFISQGIFSLSDITFVLQEGKENVIINQSQELPYALSGKTVNIGSIITDNSVRSIVYQSLLMNYPSSNLLDLQIIADISQHILKQNVFFDEIYTENQILKVRQSVEPVVVKIEKGDYILKKDTLVTNEMLYTLQVLNSKRVIGLSIVSAISRILIIVLLLLVWFIYSINKIQYSYRRVQYTNIMLSLFLISLVLGFLISWKSIDLGIKSFDSLMPFLLVGMIAVTITNNINYGIASVLLLASVYSFWPSSNFSSIFYFVILSYIVEYMIKDVKGRFDIVKVCLKSVFYSVLISLFFCLLNNIVDINSLVLAGLGSALNIVIIFIIYSIIIPIFEHVFNIPTKQRLVELAYVDNDTLSQLSQVAQGTYNHVKNVSDLAYAAAAAIGANSELCLVGARYHDIGKMVHPEYFIENQNEKNVHDNLSSQLSRSIIKSHVRLGMEKGKEIGLPREVLDIIGEHHGNDIIKFFFNEAVKNAGVNDTIVKEDFMYDGNIPSTKESAIVMLADCVEAASRTIKKPSHQRYEKLIRQIISEKIIHSQLDDSGLTMIDLKLIRDAFIPPLLGRDHHRISYDNDKD